MKRKVWWLLVFGLLCLLIGHGTANILPYDSPHLIFLNSFTHTAPSIWIRLWSVPLRVGFVSFLASSLQNCNAETKDNAPILLPTLLSLWALIALYYSFDIFLTHALFQFGGIALSLIGVIGWFFSQFNTKLLPAQALASLLILALGIWISQYLNGSNNAFTLFGMQGLALVTAVMWPKYAKRSLYFILITPALGYLFPLAEKLMLNPLGWLSGETLTRYADIYGYELSGWQGLTLSIFLLIFQGLFALALYKPRTLLWLYPIAIVFHLIAGIVLGFSPALNPWIVSLILSFGVLFLVKTVKTPHISFGLEG